MSWSLVILPGADWTEENRVTNRGFHRFLEPYREQFPQVIWIEDQTWDGLNTYRYLLKQGLDPLQPLVIAAFSAGVVGALGLSWLWSGDLGLIAVDGWCVPLGSLDLCPSPRRVARLSHDLETHWNGLFFGRGEDGFYADPFVSHLQIWDQPQTVWGWTRQSSQPLRITAAEFLLDRIAAFSGVQPRP